MRIGIVAGESSGDLLGAGLIEGIRERVPDAVFEGIAGPHMAEHGCTVLFPSDKLSILGLVEVIGHYRELLAIRKHLLEYFLQSPPDVFVGIDVPDFNLTLEERLRESGIRTVHYVSPQVWAWRKYRMRKISSAVDLLLTLFPFEADFYQRHRLPARYVGHPLADRIPLATDRNAARVNLSLPEEGPIVALLPGSRVSEVRNLAQCFIQAAGWCHRQRPELRFVVPLASPLVREVFTQTLQQQEAEIPITLVDGQSREVMAAADVVLLASGTATLEALLLKRPMVVAYRMAWLTYAILKRWVRVAHYSLPNLLAGEQLVPEFVQHAARPDVLGQTLLSYLDDPAKTNALVQRFTDMHHALRQDTNRKAADAVLELAASRRTDTGG